MGLINCPVIHIIGPRKVIAMAKNKSAATLERTKVSGQFVVKRSSGSKSVHTVKKSAASALVKSKEKHREALRRLANR